MSRRPHKAIFLLIISCIIAGNFLTAGATAFASTPIDPETLRHQIRDILNDSHFSYLNPWIWVARIIKSLKKFFNLFPTPQTRPNPELTKILKWLAILIAVTIPYWLFRYGNLLLRREIRTKQAQPLISSQPISAENLESQATERAKQQEFREAVRLLYLACLTRFRDQGLLPQTTNRPDRENLRTITRLWGTDQPAGLAFAGLIQIFQEKWYGLKSCERDDYQKSLELARLIRARLKDAHR